MAIKEDEDEDEDEDEKNRREFQFKPDVHELSECIAIAITFATIQSRRKIHGSPTIRIHPAGFDLVVYNPEFDVLLISYFGWTRKSFLILWIVLHYKIFPVTHTCMRDLQECSSGYVSFIKQCNKLPKATYQYGTSKELLALIRNRISEITLTLAIVNEARLFLKII